MDRDCDGDGLLDRVCVKGGQTQVFPSRAGKHCAGAVSGVG
jgi:hypothetical protein